MWRLSGTTDRGAGLTGALHTPLMQLSLGDRGQGHCDLWKPAQPYTTVPRLPERTGGGSGAMGCQVPSSAAPYSVAQLCAFSSQLSPCLSGRDCLCAKARDPSRSGLRWFCMDLLAACPVSASGAHVPPARQQDMRTLLCDPVEQGGAVHSLSPVRGDCFHPNDYFFTRGLLSSSLCWLKPGPRGLRSESLTPDHCAVSQAPVFL